MTALNRTTAVPSNSSSDLTGVVGGALGQPSSDDGQAAQARMEQRWAQTLDEYYAQLNLEMPYNLAWNDHQRVGQERALYIRQGKWVNPLTFLFVDDWSSLESVESVSQKAKENRVRAALPSIKIRENRRGFSLMVNPASLDLSLSKNITPVYSRSGWIISYNSQPHPTLSASGQTPGFYVQDSLGMGGITRTRRSWSGAWNNLMDLVNLFRNNATKRYDGNQSRIHHVGTVHIDFEGWNYEGSFRNLSIREVAGQPFMLEYSFDFDVRDMWFSSSLSARAGGNQYIR